MILEKVYDELNEQLQDLKKQVAALSGAPDVSITPTLESGEKIADFSIGEEEGVLYAPTIPPIPDGVQYKVLYEDAAGFSGDSQSVTLTDYLENYDVVMALVNAYSGTDDGNRYYTPLVGVFADSERVKVVGFFGSLRYFSLQGTPETLTCSGYASSGGEAGVIVKVFKIIGYKFNASEIVPPETRSKKKK